MKRCAVMGFGNPVRGDDAVGCLVISELKKGFSSAPNVSLFDMGTNGFEVLFALQGHCKIIVVDAVLETDQPVGNIYKLPAEEVLKAPEDDPLLFLHGMKWNQGLSYAKKIMGEDYPEDITAYLISISNTSLVEKMNEEVRRAGLQLATMIQQELHQWSS